MTRLTITVKDDLHQALKETAARTGNTIGKLIEEGLILRGIQSLASAKVLVATARSNAALSEDDAMDIAISETRLNRNDNE